LEHSHVAQSDIGQDDIEQCIRLIREMAEANRSWMRIRTCWISQFANGVHVGIASKTTQGCRVRINNEQIEQSSLVVTSSGTHKWARRTAANRIRLSNAKRSVTVSKEEKNDVLLATAAHDGTESSVVIPMGDDRRSRMVKTADGIASLTEKRSIAVPEKNFEGTIVNDDHDEALSTVAIKITDGCTKSGQHRYRRRRRLD
jgi:hypothetical protein